MNLEYVLPKEIEVRSFEIIEKEIADKFGDKKIPEEIKSVVMRVIHATADFDYLENLIFSENAIKIALETIKDGAVFVTDTNMAMAGINKSALRKFGCEAVCFMSDEDVAEAAKQKNITRAAASADKAVSIKKPVIYAVGNAPTALVRICEYIERGEFSPALVIGAPVGFVNVVQSKEMLIAAGIPHIAAKGRKGGSTVAAAVCNALLYMAEK
ncbi:MAG: precorrin-8X methylmutase [Prevotella sp.]|nr:precorrin-8X methylmutase [Prevotella sp.]